jgi:glucokinase
VTIATIGVDIGGTKVGAVVCDHNGVVLHRTWRRHEARGYSATLETIDDVVAGCLDAAALDGWRVAAVGVAIAAWLDADRLRVREAANLGFSQRPLAADLRTRLGRPVRLVNDGDAAAAAEAYFGAGVGEHMVVVLTLGTGVGGGIVLDGRPFTGSSGLAAELGHIQVVTAARRCVCGSTGCLELLASGTAVAQAGRSAAATGEAPLLLAMARGDPRAVTSDDVAVAASAGDAGARRVLAEAGAHLGTALGVLTSIVDPSIVVLSGGLAAGAGEIVVPAAQAALEERMSLGRLRVPPRIRLARAGQEAGARGAAALVRDEIRPHSFRSHGKLHRS